MKVVKVIPPNQDPFCFLDLVIIPHEDYIVTVQEGPGESPRIVARADTLLGATKLAQEQHGHVQDR